jgi:hypothetical protein
VFSRFVSVEGRTSDALNHRSKISNKPLTQVERHVFSEAGIPTTTNNFIKDYLLVKIKLFGSCYADGKTHVMTSFKRYEGF